MPRRETVRRIEEHGKLFAGERSFHVSYRIRLLREIHDGTTFTGRDDTSGLFDTQASLVASSPEAFLPVGTKAVLERRGSESLAVTLRDALSPKKRCRFLIDDASSLLPGD